MKLPHHLLGTGAVFLLAGLLAGCASVQAPLPPSLELPKPPTDLRAVRKGNRVYLFWTVPAQTMDRQSVRRQGPARLCRSLEALMSTCGTPVGNVAPATIPETHDGTGVKTKPQATFVDILPAELQQQNSTRMVTYAVETLNLHARSAGLSNQVQVPLAPTLPPPANVRAEVTAEGTVLAWDCETFPQEPSGVRYVYRIYQRSLESGVDASLADVECPGGRFVDRTIEWQKKYEYRIAVVTFVTLPRGAMPCPRTPPQDGVVAIPDCIIVLTVDGDDSPAQEIFTNDVYPPGVPTGMQAVFSGPAGQAPFVDVLWAPDTDADLAGYDVYRREEAGQPAKINAEVVKTPAFRDTNVEGGKTYWYSVSAVDARGNESARSEETSETVPKQP
jgi:hypothetical protein